MRLGHQPNVQDATQAGLHFGTESQWNPYAHRYTQGYFPPSQSLQRFPPSSCSPISNVPQESHCAPGTVNTIPNSGVSECPSSNTSFQMASKQRTPPGTVKDSLLVARYNNSMTAMSEMCLTDRLTELRHGLSGAASTNCNNYGTHISNSSFAFLAGNNPAQTTASTVPYLAVGHNSYSFLSTRPGYYGTGSGNTNPLVAAAAGMYLGPPMVPPSLLYPQLYTGMAQNQSHPSVHFLGNDVRPPADSRTTEQGYASCTSTSRDSNTGDSVQHSECSSGHSNRSSVSVENGQQPSSASPMAQVSSNQTFSTEHNGHIQTDINLWRPY